MPVKPGQCDGQAEVDVRDIGVDAGCISWAADSLSEAALLVEARSPPEMLGERPVALS